MREGGEGVKGPIQWREVLVRLAKTEGGIAANMW